MDTVAYGTADVSCPALPLPPALGAGLSYCLEQGRLASDGRTLQVSVFDLDALRAVEYAMTRRQSVLVCPADPLCPLPALIAAAIHIEAMVRNRLLSGSASASPLRVAVVTGDYRLRGFYRGLAVRERPGAGGVPLRTIVPAAAVSTNGLISVVDREDGRWSTVFVDTVAAATDLDNIDLLIADLPVPDAANLSDTGLPTVVVARDPSDPVSQRLAARMAGFGYDWALRTGAGTAPSVHGPEDIRMRNRATGAVRVVAVPAESLCSNAGLFWGDVASLVRLSGRSVFVGKLIADAFSLFHDLVGLAMPVADYERIGGWLLESRVRAIGRSARIVSDRELRDEWLPMTEAELAGVLGALTAAERRGIAAADMPATKAAVLPTVLAEALDQRKDVLVIARTAALARVYREYLSPRWWPVRVTSLGELADVPPADVAVLLGMAPSRGRWVYRSGIGREMVILAYGVAPAAGHRAPGQTAEPIGFDEAAIVARSIRMQQQSGLALSAPAHRVVSWRSVSAGEPLPRRAGPPGADPAALPEVEVRAMQPPEVPPGLWDGDDWTARIEPDATAADGEEANPDPSQLAPGVRAVFTDGSWMWLNTHSAVWRWRPYAGRTEQVEARSLAPGDELVLIDGQAHKTLLTKVLEVSSGMPELAVASAWVQYWRTALARARDRCGSYAELHRALVERGCRVQSQTVRLWCIGQTIGPDDREDVRRVGEVLADPVLTGQLAEVWRAIRTLRHAHVRLLGRLADLARAVGPAAARGRLPSDEILDRTSGLTAADVERAVVIVKVDRLESADAVPRMLTGRRRAADEPVDLIRSPVVEEQQ